MSSLTDRILLSVVPPLAYGYMRFLRWSVRATNRNLEVLKAAREERGQYILAFWHSRLLMASFVYRDGKLAMMTSLHRDAEMISRAYSRFGYVYSRGSSTRGGSGALRGMLRLAARGYDLGITPDGPRGPRRRVQPGAIAIARHTGFPIVPVTFSASPARRLASWDRTLVPRPFSRGVYVCGEPLRVPREADREEQERLRGVLEETLDEITDQADRETGIGLEEPRPPEDRG
jgi:lysophospholipid acyltransferase (LPLAT)-like uncharacterized protein